MFGKTCNLPSNLTNSIEPVYNFDSYPIELKYRIQKSQTEARSNLFNSKQSRKLYYDKYVNPIIYKKGDLLLVKNENCKKLDPLYLGPFSVVEDVSPNVIIYVDGKQKTVHKNRTRLYTR